MARDPRSQYTAQKPFIKRKSKLTVTVVICTRNRPALLEKCLAAVQKLSPPPDQVVVVDNTEGDPETEKITSLFGARYLVEPTTGMNHARKRALAERSTDLVAFLPDTIVPSSNWLASLLPDDPLDDVDEVTEPKIDTPVRPVIN
jgi:glycosyltransferase involved in cell wall biosynthesis